MEICKKEKCTGCGLCSVICPNNCITICPDDEGFVYPLINEGKCIHCGKCSKICPSNHHEEAVNENRTHECYAFQNSDVNILADSSSGGFFTAAASSILNQGGVVYAAVMTERFNVQHIRISHQGQLGDARKSKYLQSKAWPVYNRIREDIDSHRKVLFVGTPCQVAAVKKIAHDGLLITIDLLCHGVANAKIAEKYAEGLEEKQKSRLKKYYFRYKPQNERGG